MEIVEQYIQSKTGNIDLCEDTYFCNAHFACVIDGATNVSGRLFNGKTPGQLAAAIIRTAIADLKGKEDISEVIQVINQHYAILYESLDLKGEMDDKPYHRPSAAMILFSKYHRKVWMIGDCQCMFNGTLYQNIKRVDEVFEEVRSIVLKGELLKGKTVAELLKNDIGFELIKPLIRKQYNFQNETPECSLSYAVVNGYPIPPELIKTVEVPAHTEYIAFGSDGYAALFDTLTETESELARLHQLDPLCINENIGTKGIYQGYVSYDDRTYLKVKVKG